MSQQPSNNKNINIHQIQSQQSQNVNINDQNNDQNNNLSLPPLPIYKCHKCSSLIRLHPSQLETIKKQQQQQQEQQETNTTQEMTQEMTQNESYIDISLQCVYVNCSVRKQNKFECSNCSKLSLCRNCQMPLCKLCCHELKVLECNYCDAFICSQQCYTSLLKKYFNFLSDNVGLSINAHESMHFFRKLLLPPHLHSALANIKDNDLPFHVCENCKVQNCGCIDWISCVNCRKYYCVDCEDKVLDRCALEDCQSRTCCRKKEWDISCDYCNRLGNCRLIFCTKGHCSRHIIINREIGYNEINDDHDEKEQENENDNRSQVNNDNNNNLNNENNGDGDVELNQ